LEDGDKIMPGEILTPFGKLERHFQGILNILAPDWREDPHLKDTPRRTAAMYQEFFTSQNIPMTVFPNDKHINEMVVVSNIQFYSMCSHHLLPFFGVAHVGYIPSSKIVGLSKIARVVTSLAKRPGVQEELTVRVADALTAALAPLGLAVVLQAEHLCMSMRGIQKPGHRTTTSDMRGVMADHTRLARSEFLALVRS